MRVNKGIVLLTLCVFSLVSACGVLNKKRDEGAVIGAAAGAIIGGAIGSKSDNTALGAILGAAVGGAAGAYIGNYMDKQVAEIERDIEGAHVERVGEGIKITFESGILYEVNKSELSATAKSELTKLAVILNKYEDTEILIEGHTDATGPYEHNMGLSRDRAQSVGNHFAGQQVMETRFTIMGYGPDQPVADNSTTSGRQDNRRVEVAIYANGKLKKVASDQVK